MNENTTWHCAVLECDRPKNRKAAKGMCDQHYERARQASLGRRECNVEGCRRSARYTVCTTHAQANRPCAVEGCAERSYGRGWCLGHYRPFDKYGLTPDAYAALLEAQGGRCAICGVSEAESPHPLVVDHDHSCCPSSRTCGACVRGILCRSCNVGIGLLKDDGELVLAAHRYLMSATAQ